MLQQTFEQQNKVITIPEGFADREAIDYPGCFMARRGVEVFVMKFVANAEDKQRFLDTGEMWVSIPLDLNKQIAAVELFTENPFDHQTDDDES